MRHRRDRDSVGFTTSVLQHSMKKEPLQLLEPARKPGERGGPCRAAAGQRVSTECCVTVARLPRLVDLVNSPKRPEVGATPFQPDFCLRDLTAAPRTRRRVELNMTPSEGRPRDGPPFLFLQRRINVYAVVRHELARMAWPRSHHHRRG